MTIQCVHDECCALIEQLCVYRWRLVPALPRVLSCCWQWRLDQPAVDAADGSSRTCIPRARDAGSGTRGADKARCELITDAAAQECGPSSACCDVSVCDGMVLHASCAAFRASCSCLCSS